MNAGHGRTRISGARFPAPSTTPACSMDGACVRPIRSWPWASSAKFCRVSRPRSRITGAGSAISRQRTTSWSCPRTTARTASSRRSTRVSRTAVVTGLRTCGTSARRSSDSRTNCVAPAEDYGNRISYWHGVDINISGRMRNSLMFQGGTSTGRAVTDNCDVNPKLDSPSRRFCRVVAPFATQFKGLVAYTIPKVDVQVSSTIQSLPGASLAANLVVPSATVAQTLGRPSGRRRQQRDDEPHRTADALRRPHQPGRFPCRESSAIRTQLGHRSASTSST